MARTGRKDRGLLSRPNSTGKLVWYVRLYHEGKERRFGSFPGKTPAREFYEKAKQEQKSGRFFPERYQQGGYELVEDMIDRYLLTVSTKKPVPQLAEQYFPKWWKDYFSGKRLNAITAGAMEEARQMLLATVVIKAKEKGQVDKLMTPQRMNRYVEWFAPCGEYRRAGREAGQQSGSEDKDVQGVKRKDALPVDGRGSTFAQQARSDS